ncbi:cryptochrome/photolyase family protein [Streptomyces reniochalinae]|uniref:Cryptochrome/photolyase family protein n=1 Tax=Streptomyces reniochalinae TaxID=2250578 RepID=A0A367ESH8_9ACTN|nr:cryptochrome/photolyase family protein [Streptomyces reniochalinae]RCG20377.1 cryptochrome/photolyase family protein [Streptomyces reniochalinae]
MADERFEEPFHWLFGDQLGPHFLRPDSTVVMIESRSVLRRRRFHRAKAHLLLSAMRHRAAELGDRVRYLRAETYRDGLARAVGDASVTVHHPTSHAAARFVREHAQVRVLPPRGFLVEPDAFSRWAESARGGHLRMEDFYRYVRQDHALLMDGDQPAGGKWNLDTDNREPPPKDRDTLPVPAPYLPREDAIDDEVRADLDRWERKGEVSFVGRDGPRRFPASRAEARRALRAFVKKRLPTFGRWEDAMLAGDWAMSHSMLSAALNLGLLDPAECVEAAEKAYRAGEAPLNSVEGYVRQVAGWREYMWNLYWYFGPRYRESNALGHHAPLPDWFSRLDAEAVEARCLSTTLAQVRDRGWVHHIPRLMILGNHALQRGWDPAAVTDWFHRCFVDGYDWVMLTNVIGMSQYADGGRITTKPYVAGGSYINTMSDLCGPCAYRPTERTGERACPYTAGYWEFIHRHRDRLSHNYRSARAVKQLDRISDLDDVLRDARRRDPDAAP